MTAMKSTLVTLSVPKFGIRKSFKASHAERILRMSNNGGWQLPEDSPYEFDNKSGLCLKKRKAESKADAGTKAES